MLSADLEQVIDDLRQIPSHYLHFRVRDFLIDLVEDYHDLKQRVVFMENELMEEDEVPPPAATPPKVNGGKHAG